MREMPDVLESQRGSNIVDVGSRIIREIYSHVELHRSHQRRHHRFLELSHYSHNINSLYFFGRIFPTVNASEKHEHVRRYFTISLLFKTMLRDAVALRAVIGGAGHQLIAMLCCVTRRSTKRQVEMSPQSSGSHERIFSSQNVLLSCK